MKTYVFKFTGGSFPRRQSTLEKAVTVEASLFQAYVSSFLLIIPWLRHRIEEAFASITPYLLTEVWEELDFRLDVCRITQGFILLTTANAEEECLSGKAYWCYECDSWSDPRCRDPFNWTALPSELPTQKQCDGCCVKIVMNSKQPNEEIRRTCTKNIQINLFMVDHVCMYDGHKTGHMCFCEGDSCNASPRIGLLSVIDILLLLSMVTFVTHHLMI